MPNISPTVSTHAKSRGAVQVWDRLACSRRCTPARGTLVSTGSGGSSRTKLLSKDRSHRSTSAGARSVSLDSRRFPVTKIQSFDLASASLLAIVPMRSPPCNALLVLTSLIPRGLLAVLLPGSYNR